MCSFAQLFHGLVIHGIGCRLFPILLRVCPYRFCGGCKSFLYCHIVHHDNGLFIKIISHSCFCVCSLSLFGAFLIVINKESVRLHSTRQERQHFPYMFVYHHYIRINNRTHNQVSLGKRGAQRARICLTANYTNTFWQKQVFMQV